MPPRLSRFRASHCDCEACKRGEVGYIGLIQKTGMYEEPVISFELSNAADPIFKIQIGGQFVYEGPIIRTKEDLFAAFAQMTKAALAEEDPS